MNMHLRNFANSEPKLNQQFQNNFTCRNDKIIILMMKIYPVSMCGFLIFDIKYTEYPGKQFTNTFQKYSSYNLCI